MVRASGFSQGNGKNLAALLGYGGMDLAHDIKARVIGRQNPDGVDALIFKHGVQRRIGRTWTKPHFCGQIDDALSVFSAAAVNPADLDIAYTEHRLEMKLSDESTSHEADIEQLLFVSLSCVSFPLFQIQISVCGDCLAVI